MIGDSGSLLERIRQAELNAEIQPDNISFTLTLIDLYRLAVEHFQCLGKDAYRKHFLKRIQDLSSRIGQTTPSLASKADIELQVEYATQNSDEVAKRLLTYFSKTSSVLQTQIIQGLQHQKRVIAQRLAKRKQGKSITQSKSEPPQGPQYQKSESDERTVPSTASGPAERTIKPQLESEPKRKKKSKFRIMSKKQADNNVPLELFPF